MGINSWGTDMPKKPLVKQALKVAEDVKSQGIAELRGADIAKDQKVTWCNWETDNLEGLQASFDYMNKVSGLKSELTQIEDMCV